MSCSQRLQSFQPGLGELMQGCQFCLQNPHALGCDAIWTSTVLRWKWLNPTVRLQSRDCAIERAGAEPGSAKAGDVLNHGVAMLRSRCQACKYEQRWIGIMSEFRISHCSIYVSRTTHNVVITLARLYLQVKANSKRSGLIVADTECHQDLPLTSPRSSVSALGL